MSTDAPDSLSGNQPSIEPEPEVLVQPSVDPVVVTASYPTGEHLATIAQLLVGATEMCIWQDVAEVIPVRRMVHEMAWQLDRLAPAGSDISVTISAAAGHLGVTMRIPVAGDPPVLDTWLLDEASQVFSRVDLVEGVGELLVDLECSWTAPVDSATWMS